MALFKITKGQLSFYSNDFIGLQVSLKAVPALGIFYGCDLLIQP